MSEAERKKRQEYKKNRKKWMIVQIIAIVLVTVIAASSFLIYDKMNRTYYINYIEDGAIDYKVTLKENDFFEDKWLDENNAYIASLINGITADFNYKMKMDASDVSFDYSYSIIGKLIVTDSDSKSTLLEKNYEMIPEKFASIEKGDSLNVTERIDIDYSEFNDIAGEFVDAYDLRNSTSTLVVTLKVNVLSQCEKFESNNTNSYTVSLNIPLQRHTLNITTSSSVPVGESKVLACPTAVSRDIFKIIGIVCTSLDLVLIILFFVFLHFTRNEDINYTIKLKKLVSSYRSFIQQIEGEFDTEGHQIIVIKTFNELLGIRDTLQSPILMSENSDQTRARFIIPTNTDLLYMFELKVDNYDALYGLNNTEEN